MTNIASGYSILGRHNEANSKLLDALKIATALNGEMNQKNAVIYAALGVNYNDLENYNKSIEFHNKSLEIQYKTLGYSHPDVVTNLCNLSHSLTSIKDYSKALEHLEIALKINKKYFKPNHISFAFIFNSFGNAYMESNDLTNAIVYFNKALVVGKENIESGKRQLSESYNSLGLAYDKNKDYKNAIDCLKKSLLLKEIFFGFEHSETQNTTMNLILSLSSDGQMSNSIELLDKINKCKGQILENKILYLNDIALGSAIKGQIDQSNRIYDIAFFLLKNNKIKNDDFIKSVIYINYANIHCEFIDKGKALKSYRKAIKYSKHLKDNDFKNEIKKSYLACKKSTSD